MRCIRLKFQFDNRYFKALHCFYKQTMFIVDIFHASCLNGDEFRTVKRQTRRAMIQKLADYSFKSTVACLKILIPMIHNISLYDHIILTDLTIPAFLASFATVLQDRNSHRKT